jgi:hypothetical protein
MEDEYECEGVLANDKCDTDHFRKCVVTWRVESEI